MALRPYFRGYLKLSLVTCPVQMTPATTESEKVRFHTLNSKTQNRVVSQYVDAVTGKAVGEGLGHNAVVIIVVLFKLNYQFVTAYTGSNRKTTPIISYAAVFWRNKIR